MGPDRFLTKSCTILLIRVEIWKQNCFRPATPFTLPAS